jgi:hypothetical protein
MLDTQYYLTYSEVAAKHRGYKHQAGLAARLTVDTVMPIDK